MIEISSILDQLGIEYKDVGNDLRTKCWLHEEKNPSMSISKEGGYFHCFSCKTSGSLFDIIEHFVGVRGIEALKFISAYEIEDEKTDEEELEEKKKKYIRTIKKNTFEEVSLPKHKLLEAHPYLRGRGIVKEEVQRWRMGIVEEAPYKNWIIIPIYQDGLLRNYFLRSTKENRKLYGSYPMSDILFGLDDAQDFIKPIYVVEGIFDKIFLDRTGVQVVASLSNRLHSNIISPKQIQKLSKFPKVVTVPDGDNPGLQIVHDSISLLSSTEVSVCELPLGRKDTAECSIRELLWTLTNEIPLLDFILKERYVSWKLNWLIPQQSQKLVTTRLQTNYV